MMDAVKFIKAIKQMLGAGAGDSTVQKYISAYKKNDCEGMVKAAEQWAAEHPIKTRQSVFLAGFAIPFFAQLLTVICNIVLWRLI